MNLIDFNPWWEYGDVPKDFNPNKKRELFGEILKNLSRRRIDIIVGLRRVGKTTLMYQTIHKLIENGVKPKNILYFSFDEEVSDISSIVREYEEKVLRDKIRNTRAYLFFDEIQKLEGWENKVKVLYDMYPKTKMVLSGSASLNIMRGSSESLAGRAKYHYLPPLSFREYLNFKDVEIRDYYIQLRTLKVRLMDFLKRGFPEAINMDEREIEEYIQDMILTRIIYRDIPESFKIRDVEIVNIIANHILRNSGVIINVDSLASQFRRNRRTISNALSYLEMTYIIKLVRNFRGSYIASSRKNKKAYALHSSLCKTHDEDVLIETLIRAEANAQYYWRDTRREVDFIINGDKIIAIEVKNKEKIDKKDIESLKYFSNKHRARELYLVYSGDEEYEMEGVKIVPVPVFILKYASGFTNF